jgi:hypothetical protein
MSVVGTVILFFLLACPHEKVPLKIRTSMGVVSSLCGYDNILRLAGEHLAKNWLAGRKLLLAAVFFI